MTPNRISAGNKRLIIEVNPNGSEHRSQTGFTYLRFLNCCDQTSFNLFSKPVFLLNPNSDFKLKFYNTFSFFLFLIYSICMLSLEKVQKNDLFYTFKDLMSIYLQTLLRIIQTFVFFLTFKLSKNQFLISWTMTWKHSDRYV